MDITSFTADKGSWYFDFVDEIHRRVGDGGPLQEWWDSQGHASHVRHFARYLEEAAGRHQEGLVLFIDEIDHMRSLDFSDEFFGAVRSLAVRAKHDQALRRFCIILLGVASPQDLIRDPKTTPFNVGERINLVDFTREQAATLERGLGPRTIRAASWIASIIGRAAPPA